MIPNRQKLLLIVALTAVVLLAGDRLLLPPLISVWTQRAKRIADLKKGIEQGTQLLKRQKSINDRWAYMARTTLPANASATEGKVLRSVDRWAQDSRVTFSSIKPQWKQNADDYSTLECRADASGDMAALLRFVYNLEQEMLPLRVEDLQISARDTSGQDLSLAVRFTGLVLTEQDKEKP